MLQASALQAPGPKPEARSPEPDRPTQRVGVFALSAISRRFRQPICPPGSGRTACDGSVGRAAKRRGRWCRPQRWKRSKPRWISSGPSTGSSRCRSCWRGCSSRSAIVSSAQDRGVVTLHIRLKLVTREMHERSVELPAPMRDARVLRTLALLDLESNPPPAAIDRVTVGVDVTEGRVLQFGLFARALPADKLATLMARLGALMGSDRVGAPSLVDTYRPGAFAMAKFDPPRDNRQSPESLNRANPGFGAAARPPVVAPLSLADCRARHARAGAADARHDRSPRVQRRPRRTLRGPLALLGRLVETAAGTATNGM